MTAQFRTSRIGEFGLLIQGLERDGDQYLTNNIPSHRAYKWVHSSTINLLYSVNSDNEEEFIDKIIFGHEDCESPDDLLESYKEIPSQCIDTSKFELKFDGLFKVSHIILPNEEWISHVRDRDMSTFLLYDDIIYLNETDGKFYRYNINGDSEELSLEEFMKIEPSDKNTIIKKDKNVFTIYYLLKCFYKLVNDLLSSVCGNDKCPNPILMSKERDRDLVWMFINAIKYSLELNRLYTAQRLLEKLNRCNPICSNLESTNIKSNNCGC